MPKWLQFVLTVGAVKAIIPTPGHVFDVMELALASVLAVLLLGTAWLWSEHGKEAGSPSQSHTVDP